jgi:DNA-3-methyladenine glycosylase I
MLMTHQRCPWAGRDLLYVAYHDHEWGVPQTNPSRLFEMLVLEGAQAGLSWITILRKRANYWRAFESFDPQRVARFTPARIERLMADPGIVRNRLKIEGAVRNARLFLELVEETRDVAPWFWQFVGGTPKQNAWKTMREVPARTAESDAMSLALRKRGFTFVGTMICYSFMQATGMVNDHIASCFRYKEIVKEASMRRGTKKEGPGKVPHSLRRRTEVTS